MLWLETLSEKELGDGKPDSCRKTRLKQIDRTTHLFSRSKMIAGLMECQPHPATTA
jgi:hypothetical protein